MDMLPNAKDFQSIKLTDEQKQAFESEEEAIAQAINVSNETGRKYVFVVDKYSDELNDDDVVLISNFERHVNDLKRNGFFVDFAERLTHCDSIDRLRFYVVKW